MVIQIDSREKARAIKKIIEEFDRQAISHPISKLMVGDYMSYDNPRLIIDRKQNLSELCHNVCQDHPRFRRELLLARENEIQIVFLVEHGKGIKSLSDVIWWDNPRRFKRVRNPSANGWMWKLKPHREKLFIKFCVRRNVNMGVDFFSVIRMIREERSSGY